MIGCIAMSGGARADLAGWRDPREEPSLTTARMAPARPGHFAEREELEAALEAGGARRLRLFIERHPRSRYRPEAEAALRRLRKERSLNPR